MPKNDELFHQNVGLVYKVFNDCFSSYRYIEEDLVQEGLRTLWQVGKDFVEDASLASFSTYAYKCIKNAMLNYVMHEVRAAGGRTKVSLSQPISAIDDASLYEETLGQEDDMSEDSLFQLILECTIDPRERMIVQMKRQGCTQSQIASELHLSENRISELVKSLYARVKAKLDSIKEF